MTVELVDRERLLRVLQSKATHCLEEADRVRAEYDDPPPDSEEGRQVEALEAHYAGLADAIKTVREAGPR